MNTSTVVDKITIDTNRFNRFCDTILGSGESIIEFNPTIPCYFNDVNTDVVNFYNNIQDPSLVKELELILKNWKTITKFGFITADEIQMAYQDYETNIITVEDLTFMIRAIIMMNMDNEEFSELFQIKFVVSIDMLINALIKQIESALIKLKNKKENIDTCDFKKFNEQTIKNGFYEHFKNLLNFQKTDLIDCLNINKHLSIWFYIKEFGKGNHLSYDQNGNIKNHYSDDKFNESDIYKTINALKNPDFVSQIINGKITNSTISDFLLMLKPTEKDLIIANLNSTNLILSTGKNHSTLQTHYDIIKPLFSIKSNVLILSNDEQITNDILKKAPNEFKLKQNGVKNYIANFDI